jgi:hypothetical protein
MPTKFVPQIEIARTLGIPQPLTEEMTREAEKLTGTDLWAKGRTLSKLGLTEKDIRNYSQQGLHPYMERNDLTRYTAAKFQSCGGI